MIAPAIAVRPTRAGSPAGGSLWDAAVPVAYTLLALTVMRSWWASLGGRVTAVNEPDAVLFSWLLTATPHAIAEGRFPLYSDLLNHPDGVNLMWNNGMALPALLFAPVTAVFGGLGTVTVVTTLGLAGTAAAAYGCLRVLGVGVAPAAVGGLLAGFSPAMIAQAVGGHPNLVFNVLVPVILLLAVRLMTDERPSPRTAVLLGVLAGLQVLIGEEVLLLTGVVTALFLLVLVATRPRVAAARAPVFAARAALASGVFALVAAVPLGFQLFGPLPQRGSPWDTAYYTVDLAGHVVATPLQAHAPVADEVRSDAFAGGPEEHTAFLGWALIVVAVAAFVLLRRDARVRTTLLVALGVAVLGLGPELTLDGAGTGVPLPWAVVTAVPGFEHVIATRFPLLTAGLLGAGLAFALDRPGTGPARVVGFVAVVAALVPLVPTPAPARETPEVPAWFAAAPTCPGGSILVLPFPTSGVTDALWWQQAAGLSFAMPGGYIIGPDEEGRARVGARRSPTGELFSGVRADGMVREPTEEMRAQFRADVEEWGACAAVLGPSPRRDALSAQATALIGYEPEEVDGVLLWPDLGGGR